MIMTYEDIYKQMNEDTGDRFTLLQLIEIFRNESDWVGTSFQLMKMKELLTNITGIRPGNCSGCNINVLVDMNRWVMNYEKEHPTEEVKPKLGRPKAK